MTTTIERTGKFWKGIMAAGIGQLAVGSIVFFSSVDYFAAGERLGSFLIVAGVVCITYGYIGAWWHHG